MELKLTIEDLERLLNEQKRIVIEKLSGHTYYYNNESTESVAKDLPINKTKFSEVGMQAKFPSDFETLKRYVK